MIVSDSGIGFDWQDAMNRREALGLISSARAAPFGKRENCPSNRNPVVLSLGLPAYPCGSRTTS